MSTRWDDGEQVPMKQTMNISRAEPEWCLAYILVK